MPTTLQEHFAADSLGTIVGFAAILFFYLSVTAPIAGGILYGFYFLLTLPMRRNERARMFLDLLELGLQQGRTPKAAAMEIPAGRDASLGKRAHFLSGYLQSGMRLSEGLALVPRLLPPQVRAMLQAGERIGDVGKVLPACRQLLRDSLSQVRGAINYLVLLAFCITPLTLVVPMIFSAKVLPQFNQIFKGMGGHGELPAFSQFVFSQGSLFFMLQAAFLGFLWLLLFAYVGGPRLQRWLEGLVPGVPDWVFWQLPWRRKRLQRDFSSVLAVLLDAGMPESEAVGLAAESTANGAVVKRAARAQSQLARGVRLPDALRVMDDAGELQWRLSNALHQRGGFRRALTGWHEALDAKAFQLEQTAAQVATTSLVLMNGVIVACIVIAVFLMLINLIFEASLW
jgi:type II secretory pathway component PulF